ncbi:MAG: hypothetical protein COB02_04030 [Candidatus Cloacimonadota bacterium]|nr:MAG: hypothetical protein COB02_04030 [Candidatus Cloacimonadota bacterium]
MNAKTKIDTKLKWVRLSLLLIFLIIASRLYYIQIIKHDFWQKKANKQHFSKKKVLRRRGTIFDRNGNQLAFTAAVKQMTCDPTKVKNPEATLSMLSRFTRLEVKPLLKKLLIAKKKKRRYLLLKRDVSSQEYLKIKAKMKFERKNLPSPNDFGILANCIYFEDSYKRYYPYNMIASNVLGFVGRDQKGLEGVELFYENLLKSEDGIISYERGLNGLIIPNSERKVRKASGGTSIYLTLDVVIQYIVEKRLREAFEVNRPKSAVVVVMNPNNGEILAMASQPNYNPNYYRFYSSEDFKNRVISDQVEPGSTMKVFTVAAALESNAITILDDFSCNGYIELYDVFRIHCDGRRSHGSLDCSHILKKSCNVGAIQIGQRLGTRRLYEYMRLFGFGEKTGIQLPGEIKGLNRHPRTWSGLSLAAKSIGQEVAVNSLQVARAFGSIVNGGILYQPQILFKTKTFEGKTSEIAKNPIRRVIQKKNADLLVGMLKTVTQKDGSGKRAYIPGYRVAGKTGTAQSLAEMHKERDPFEEEVVPHVASFVGAVPADDPRLVIYIMLNEPKGEKYYGGQVAAPMFSDLGKEILAYLNVEPDPSLKEEVEKTNLDFSPDKIRQESGPSAGPDWTENSTEVLVDEEDQMPEWLRLDEPGFIQPRTIKPSVKTQALDDEDSWIWD